MTKIKIFTWLCSFIIILSLCNTLIAQQLEEYVPKIIIQAKWGNGPGEFGVKTFGQGQTPAGPKSMSVDTNGNIYILDPVNQRIQKFSSDGKYITSINYSSNSESDFFSECVYMEVDGRGNIYLSVPNSIKGYDEIFQFNKNGNLVRKFSPPDFNCDGLGWIYKEENDEVIIFSTRKKILKPGYSEFHSDGRKFKILPDGKIEVYKGEEKSYGEMISIQRIDKNTVLLKIDKEQILVKLNKKITDKGLSLGEIGLVRKDKEGGINIFVTAIPEDKNMRDITKWKWFLYKYDKDKNLTTIIDRQTGKGSLYSKYGYEYIDHFGNYYKLTWNDQKPEEGIRVIKWVKKE